MPIQFFNAFLLIFAGFLAGNYFSGAPKTEKMQIPSAPQVSVTPLVASGDRGPASIPAMPLVSQAAAAAEPVDLAAYLLKFGIGEVHEACEFARNRFLDQTVAAHARFVEGLDNFDEHENYLNSLGRRLAENEKFWIGRTQLDLPDGKADLEVIMDSHAFLPDAGDDDNASCFRAHVRLNFANGHRFSNVIDACTDSLVTKNRNYYLNWESFSDIEIGRQVSVVQIPLPESNGAELEFMSAGEQKWASALGFRWEAVPLDRGLQMIDEGSPTMAENRSSPEP